MKQTIQLTIFTDWVERSCVGTSLYNNDAIKRYIAGACCSCLYGFHYDHRDMVQLSLQLNTAAPIDDFQARSIANHGLVQHIIFGDNIDMDIHRTTLSAFRYLSRHRFDGNHQTDFIIANSFLEVDDLLKNMRKNNGTGLKLFVSVYCE